MEDHLIFSKGVVQIKESPYQGQPGIKIQGRILGVSIDGGAINPEIVEWAQKDPESLIDWLFRISEYVRRKMGLAKQDISKILVNCHKRVHCAVDVISESKNKRFRIHKLSNGQVELREVYSLIVGGFWQLMRNSRVLETYNEIPLAEAPFFKKSQYRIEVISKTGISVDQDIPLETKKTDKIIPKLSAFPQSLLDRYEPLEFLGEGGFARVYKARRKEDGKIVALKIPRIDEKTGRLFVKEVASWYQLNHPNIVTLYEANVYPIPYIEMEFVEGVEVDGKLVRDLEKYPKPVDEKTALKLITGIARGLAHAHSKGIYHLDLKPLNVLLKADLRPKITDWGLAKISARSSLSRHYGYSPLYAAPEQLDEETFGVPDHRTDIYQLGLIFYELLTGELPYKATSPGALVGKILYAKPKPISELKPELKKFDGIFEKLLAKRKEERYGSVEEFLSALKSLTELEREKEELKKTSMAMRRSRSREEFERLKVESIRKTVKIAILSAKLNDKAELLTALDDLKFYTRENLDDLLNAIAQIEMLLKEGVPISPEVEERIRALVLRIEGEALM